MSEMKPAVLSCIFCVLACGFLTGGIISLELASEERREHRAVDYVQAVHDWTGRQHRQDFEGLGKISVTARHDGKDFSTSLESNKTRDPLKDSGYGEVLPSYEALKYARRGVSSDYLPVIGYDDLVKVIVGSRFEWWGLTMAFEFNLGGSRIAPPAVPLVMAVAHHEPNGLYNHCHNTRGRYNNSNGRCWVYSRLERLCVQVQRVAYGGGWQLAPRVPGQNKSYGCDYKASKWPAGVYSKVTAEDIENRAEHFDHLVLEVRSSDDPFFKALELTGGTLDFGIMASEEQTLGIVLIFMGCVFSCPCTCAAIRTWRKNRAERASRYRPHRYHVRRGPRAETLGMKSSVDGAGMDDEEDRYWERTAETSHTSESRGDARRRTPSNDSAARAVGTEGAPDSAGAARAMEALDGAVRESGSVAPAGGETTA